MVKEQDITLQRSQLDNAQCSCLGLRCWYLSFEVSVRISFPSNLFVVAAYHVQQRYYLLSVSTPDSELQLDPNRSSIAEAYVLRYIENVIIRHRNHGNKPNEKQDCDDMSIPRSQHAFEDSVMHKTFLAPAQ